MSEEYDFYATLHSTRSRRQIARLFRPPIWRVRKCTWTDYEIASEFAELTLEAESPALLHGWVTDLEVNTELVLAPLRAGAVAYTAEVSKTGGDLQRKFTWGWPDRAVERRRPVAAALAALIRFLGGPVR